MRPRRPPVRPAPLGFTLVELLVVIFIIAVLISLLLPTLAGVRRRARTAACLANLRHLSNAFQVLVVENDGTVPYAGDVSKEQKSRSFGPLMVEHLLFEGRRPIGVQSPAMFCPAATEPPLRVRGAGDEHYYYPGSVFRPYGWDDDWPWGTPLERFRGSSYGMNGWVDPRTQHTPFGPYFQWPLKEPGLVPLFADATYEDGWPSGTDAPPVSLNPYVPAPSIPGREVYGIGQIFAIPRHGRAVNVLFADGHATTLALQELWKLKWGPSFVPRDVTLPP